MTTVFWPDPRTRSRSTTAGGPAISGISLTDITRTLRRLRSAASAQLAILEQSSESAGPMTGAAVIELSHTISEIDAALGRIDDGSYGACHRCGAMIASSRLAALPATRYCAVCG